MSEEQDQRLQGRPETHFDEKQVREGLINSLVRGQQLANRKPRRTASSVHVPASAFASHPAAPLAGQQPIVGATQQKQDDSQRDDSRGIHLRLQHQLDQPLSPSQSRDDLLAGQFAPIQTMLRSDTQVYSQDGRSHRHQLQLQSSQASTEPPSLRQVSQPSQLSFQQKLDEAFPELQPLQLSNVLSSQQQVAQSSQDPSQRQSPRSSQKPLRSLPQQAGHPLTLQSQQPVYQKHPQRFPTPPMVRSQPGQGTIEYARWLTHKDKEAAYVKAKADAVAQNKADDERAAAVRKEQEMRSRQAELRRRRQVQDRQFLAEQKAHVAQNQSEHNTHDEQQDQQQISQWSFGQPIGSRRVQTVRQGASPSLQSPLFGRSQEHAQMQHQTQRSSQSGPAQHAAVSISQLQRQKAEQTPSERPLFPRAKPSFHSQFSGNDSNGSSYFATSLEANSNLQFNAQTPLQSTPLSMPPALPLSQPARKPKGDELDPSFLGNFGQLASQTDSWPGFERLPLDVAIGVPNGHQNYTQALPAGVGTGHPAFANSSTPFRFPYDHPAYTPSPAPSLNTQVSRWMSGSAITRPRRTGTAPDKPAPDILSSPPLEPTRNLLNPDVPRRWPSPEGDMTDMDKIMNQAILAAGSDPYEAAWSADRGAYAGDSRAGSPPLFRRSTPDSPSAGDPVEAIVRELTLPDQTQTQQRSDLETARAQMQDVEASSDSSNVLQPNRYRSAAGNKKQRGKARAVAAGGRQVNPTGQARSKGGQFKLQDPKNKNKAVMPEGPTNKKSRTLRISVGVRPARQSSDQMDVDIVAANDDDDEQHSEYVEDDDDYDG